MKYLIHCIMYKGIGIEVVLLLFCFCFVFVVCLFFGGVPSHCGLYWNEISDKLAKQGAMKNMSDIIQ